MLDGRYWRQNFGGSTGNGPKTGAYICFGAVVYAVVRALFLFASIGVLVAQLARHSDNSGFLLYLSHLTTLVAVLYFAFAAGLTGYAVFTNGVEAPSTPPAVRICWALYGMLFPGAYATMFCYCFVL